MKKFGLILVLSSFVAVGLTGCGQAPTKPTSGSTPRAVTAEDLDGDGINDKTGEKVADVSNIPMDVSLASFKANLYEPILVPFCQECHASTFVDTNIEKAHLTFLEKSKLNNFPGVEASFPVDKMKHAHNYWE